MPLRPTFVAPVRQMLVGQVRKIVGGTGDDTVERNRRDTGLFGPDSACWKVHGDFPSMMVGGITALLLQMLHPGALAGVWDHSNFRHDMSGRLKRTARFIAGTTYGDRAEAEALIARVLAVHAVVKGVLPGGVPYSAQDPALLTWVHATEVSSFLTAYTLYVDPNMAPSDQDQYFRETGEIARRLGASDVPQSREEITMYLVHMRPNLRYDERTQQVAQALLSEPPPNPAAGPALAVAFGAAKNLLPVWAADMHGFRRSQVQTAAVGVGMAVMARSLRWALTNSAETRARRRASELLSTGELER